MPTATREHVLTALARVVDPASGRNIVEADIVQTFFYQGCCIDAFLHLGDIQINWLH